MEDNNEISNYNLEKKLIFKKYRVGKLIFKSKLSNVHEGINVLNGEQVAIKFEKTGQKYNLLESEAYFLFLLKGEGIPIIISYGKIIGFKVIIEELLGESIYLLWKNNTFDIKNKINDLCLIAIQCLDRIKYIHSKNTIHRDIKPLNFLFGKKDPKLIYLIDFGIAKKYRSSRTGKHIKFKSFQKTNGSLRYMSINGNNCCEQSRRDDLESLGYTLIYLIKKTLPWKNIENLNIDKWEKYRKVRDLKISTLPEELCSGLPKEFCDYIKYCRNLSFEQEPNYNYLKNLFLEIIKKNENISDAKYIKLRQFSWMKTDNKRISKIEYIKNAHKPSLSRLENLSSSRGKENTHKRLYSLIKKSIDRANSQESSKIKNSNYIKLNMNNINIILNSVGEIDKKINKKNSKKKINIKNQENKNYNSFNINEFIHKKVGKTHKINKRKKILLPKPPEAYKTISQEILNMNNTENSINSLTLKKFRNPISDDFLKKVHYSKNNIYSKINSKRQGYYKTLGEREKEKEEKMRMIKDRIKKKTNLSLKYDSSTNNNFSNSNNDFTRIPIEKRKKLSLNVFQLKNLNKEKYYINNKYLTNYDI